MARIVLYLVILVGIGYGAYALFRGDGESGEGAGERVGEGAGAGRGEVGDGGEADGPDESPVEADPEKAAEIVREADDLLEQAGAAGSRAEAQGLKDQARRRLTSALFETPAGEGSAELMARIEDLNRTVLLSEEAIEGQSFLYIFQPTDNLWTLCSKGFPGGRKVSVSHGFILWMNDISDARRIQAGQILKITTQELSLLVTKSRFELWVMLGGVFLKSYPVGLGVDDKTPEGTFTIGSMIVNPAWYRGGRKIPFGHPENRLGTRWMGFKRTPRAAGYGIHGTDQPETVGKAVSEGCIRMANADVEELFTWLKLGTTVRLLR